MNDRIDPDLETRIARLGSTMEGAVEDEQPYAGAIGPAAGRRRPARLLVGAAAALALVVGGAVAIAASGDDADPVPVAQEGESTVPASTEAPPTTQAAPGEVVVPDDGGVAPDLVPAEPTPAAQQVAAIIGGQQVEFNVMPDDASTWTARFVAEGETELVSQVVFRTSAALPVERGEPKDVYLPGDTAEVVEVAGADAAFLRLNYDRTDVAVVVGDRSFVLTVGLEFGLDRAGILEAASEIARSGALG